MNGFVGFLAGAVATALVATDTGRRLTNELGRSVSASAKRKYDELITNITPPETGAADGTTKEENHV